MLQFSVNDVTAEGYGAYTGALMGRRADRKRRERHHKPASNQKGRPPGRWSVPHLRPIMVKALGGGPSAADVADALAEFAPGSQELCDKTISCLFHRSSLGHEKKTLEIAGALLSFCNRKSIKVPKGRGAHHFDAAISPTDFAHALRAIGQRLDTAEPHVEVAQRAAVPVGVVNAISKGIAMPHVLVQHVASTMNALGGPTVIPVPWAIMSWGRDFLENGEIRYAVEEWIVQNDR